MKLKPSDLLLLRDKNFLNNKNLNFEDNSFEYKLNNNSNYNLYNLKEGGYPYISKSKLFNDNNSSKINMNMNNNKSTINKKNNFNEDINNAYNYNYNNKLSSRNIGFIGISKKQSKLVLFDQNKNFGIFNNPNVNKEKKIYKNKSQLNNIKEIPISKNYNTKKSGKNKCSSSAEPKIKKVTFSQKSNNEDNNNSALYINHTRNLTNNNVINKKVNISMKENCNKSIDDFPYINNKNLSVPKNNSNNIDNIKKILNGNNDMNILKSKSILFDNNIPKNNNNINIDTHETKNKILSKSISIIKNSKNKNEEKIKSLSGKEKAYYILSQSKILQLNERIIFSRANEKIRSLITIKELLESNQTFIQNKITEFEQKILEYNKYINSSFIPSKIAIISLNLIMRDDKDDFINFIINNENLEEKEKEYYNIYIGILFILLGEKDEKKNDINILYNELSVKGYENFKDYFYEIFIVRKQGKEFFDEINMCKFNEMFEKLPDLIKYQGDIKTCRFISFSYFLILEIYQYWNKLKESINIKNETNSYIHYLKDKISYINNYSKI